MINLVDIKPLYFFFQMVVVPLRPSHTEENMINIRSICHTLPRNNFSNKNAQIAPQVQLRSFMAYLNAIFNSVDEGKVKCCRMSDQPNN